MNKKYPTFFLTLFNKFSRVPYPGTMINWVQKFRHYFLANHFIFYVDHRALLYLINRPVVSGRIARWMLLLQEYDFEAIYKPGRSHVMADHLSRIESGEDPSGVQDQFPDASLFMVHV